MNSASIFHKSIEKITEILQQSLYYNLSKLANVTKQTFNQKDYEGFPQTLPGYTQSVNKCVLLGRSNPEVAISTLLEMFPFSSKKDLYDNFVQKSLFNIKLPLAKTFCDYAAMHFFADCAAQLITYVKQPFKDSSVFPVISSLNLEKINIDPLFNEVVADLRTRLCSQLAVIISGISENFSDDIFARFTQKINAKGANVNDLFTLYKFIRYGHTIQEALAFFNANADHYKDNVYMWIMLRNMLIQLPMSKNPDIPKVYKLIKKYAEKKSDFQGYVIECKTILKMKYESLDINLFVLYIKSVFEMKHVKWIHKLKCLLIMLQGGNFHYESEFWVRGQYNGLNTIQKEVSHIWQPHIDPKEITNLFVANIENFIADQSIYDVVNKILLNLSSRSLLTLHSIIPPYITSLRKHPNSEASLLPIFSSMSKILNPKNKFTEYIKSNKPSSEVLATTMSVIKSPLLDILASMIPSESQKAYKLHSLSVYQCPQFIDPNYTMISESNDNKETLMTTYEEKFKEFNRKVYNIKTKARIPFVDESCVSASNVDMVICNVICNILPVATEFDFKLQENTFLTYLMRCAISKSVTVAQFALFAIQYLYIRNSASRKNIHMIITNFLIQRISQPIAFTLLSLENQLISLPYSIYDKDDLEWFTEWVDKFQAMFLMQLSNPYYECRYMACVTSNRFQEIVDESDDNDTIFLEIEKNHPNMMERVQARMKNVQIPAATFIEFCTCSNAQFFAIYYSEILCLSAQEKFHKVVEIIFNLKPEKLLEIPPKYGKGKEKPREPMLPEGYTIREFNHSLLLSTLVFRLQMWTSQRLSIINKVKPFLQDGSFITVYPNLKPLTIQSDTMLRIQFLSNNINKIIQHSSENDFWAKRFLANFINTASPSSVSLINQLVLAILTPLNEEKHAIGIVDCILDLYLETAKSIDFQVILLTSMSEMNTITSVLRSCLDCVKQLSKRDEVAKRIYVNSIHLMISLCNAARPVFSAGSGVSVINPDMFQFINEWSKKDRSLLLSTVDNVKSMYEDDEDVVNICNKATVMLIGTPMFYENKEEVKDFKRKERKNIVLKYGTDQDIVTILRTNPVLFSFFIQQALKSGSKFSRFAKALFKLYVDDKDDKVGTFSVDVNKSANKSAFKHRGQLIVISLIKLTSFEYSDRYLAFSCIKRLLPVFSAIAESKDLSKIACINGYLKSHENSILSRGEPTTKEELFNLTHTICANMPSIIPKIIICSLNCITSNASSTEDVSNTILIIKAASPYIDLKTFDANFLSTLIDTYSTIDDKIKSSYCDIFVALGSLKADNRKTLINSLFSYNDEKYNTTITKILIDLNISQPIDYLGITVQSLTFQSWYYNNIVKDQESNLPFSNVNLSLKVIEKLVAINVTHILPVIHVIIHFCLLSIDKKVEYRATCVQILNTIINIFSKNNRISITELTRFSFEEETTTDAITIDSLVLDIIDAFREKVPLLRSQWQQVALKWAFSCGDIELANKSVVILRTLCDKDGLSLQLISPLMRSLQVVHQCILTDNNRKIVEKYTTSVLGLFFDSVLSTDSDGNTIIMNPKSFPLAKFVTPFIFRVNEFPKAVTLALKIITEFTNAKFFYDFFKIEFYLSDLAKILNGNDQLYALKFFARYLEIIPDSEENARIETLCYILPLLYGAFCGFHSFDPYSTGYDDDFIDCAVNEISRDIINKIFDRSPIGTLFDSYFNPSKVSLVSPEKFLKEITSFLTVYYPNIFKNVSTFWTVMAKSNNQSNFTAVFSVIQSLIQNSNDPESLIAVFSDIIDCAIDKNTIRSFDFLYTVSQHSKDSKNEKKAKNTSKGSLTNTKEFHKELQEAIELLPKVTKFENEVDTMTEFYLPMVPLIESLEVEHVRPEQKELIKNVVFQPFDKQIKEFKNQAKGLGKQSAPKEEEVDPTAEDFYVHSNLTWEEDLRVNETKVCDALPPEFFMIYDQEAETFFDRIAN